MNIDEAILEKQRLEERILALLTEFCAKTGLCIDNVALRYIDVTKQGDNRPHNILHHVICSVSL